VWSVCGIRGSRITLLSVHHYFHRRESHNTTSGKAMLSTVACQLVLLLTASAAVQAALFPPKTPVVQLSQSNFKREILSIEKPTMVMFSAPWCGHCKTLAPHFHKAASTLDGIVKFANLDCDQDVNKGLCAEYQVKGFPTVKLFPATKKRLPREYRGERTANALIEYAKGTLPLGARKVAAEELANYVNEDPSRPKVILFSDK
jgi:protein disulfide-isomerase A6